MDSAEDMPIDITERYKLIIAEYHYASDYRVKLFTVSRSFQNRNILELAKQDCLFGAIGEEQHGFLFGIGRGGQDGVMA